MLHQPIRRPPEVVNDLASVNIDSQLLRSYDDGLVELAELQNGHQAVMVSDLFVQQLWTVHG